MINIENIRACMIKQPDCYLWVKVLKKWTESDKKLFNTLLEGKDIKVNKSKKALSRKVKRSVVNAVKVMRVSDGKIYTSISACKEHNKFHDVEMRTKLNKGIEFKRI